MLRYDRQS